MAKIDLKSILIAAASAAASQVANDPSTNMNAADATKVVRQVEASTDQHSAIAEAQKTIDVKTNQEPWYQSVQAWVAILTGLMSILGAIGLVIPQDIQKEVMSAVPLLIGFSAMCALIYNRYFRFRQ
jgi:hypothetical protein